MNLGFFIIVESKEVTVDYWGGVKRYKKLKYGIIWEFKVVIIIID